VYCLLALPIESKVGIKHLVEVNKCVSNDITVFLLQMLVERHSISVHTLYVEPHIFILQQNLSYYAKQLQQVCSTHCNGSLQKEAG
jgi:polyhydroxyalkanoate synthesis regulator protein